MSCQTDSLILVFKKYKIVDNILNIKWFEN
jgi:hypothetical protein